MDLSKEVELLVSLFSRENLEDAFFTRLQAIYLHAPKEMLHTIAFHLEHASGSLLDALTNLEELLRGDSEKINYGTSWHILYHLYNYLVIQNFLPMGNKEIISELELIMEDLNEDSPDIKSVLSYVENLKNYFTGDTQFPKEF